jgi:deazaflavin-dependent oxidoreductase (nitroreductase family)
VRTTLTTTGRRTGLDRVVTLYAFPDDGRLVIVGSRGGASTDPHWAMNLRADPRAVVGRGRSARQVHAREVDGPEHDRLWRLVCEAFPLYETYQRRTTRRIPLFVLEPAEPPELGPT